MEEYISLLSSSTSKALSRMVLTAFTSPVTVRTTPRLERCPALCHSRRGNLLCRRSFRMSSDKTDSDNNKEPHDIPKSTVDWNSEWSSFRESGGRSMAPKGREPVSKEELARKKTMNSIRSVTNRVPSRQALFADWRFWVAIILTLSVFSAFVQSSAMPPSVGGSM